MPKYLLLRHYRGGPEQHRPAPPMDLPAVAGVKSVRICASRSGTPASSGS